MRSAKVKGLGIPFSFAGFIILLLISIMRASVSFETVYATGLSAVVGGLFEAFLNPITWLVIVAGFVAATVVTRKTSNRTSTF